MKSFVLFATPIIALATLPASTVLAQQNHSRFALGAQVGTPGAGVQLLYSLNDYVVLRGGYDVLKWDSDQTYKGIEYEADVDFQSPGAFVDLHPFKNGFFVSGGAYFGDRGVDINATPDDNVNIGGRAFTPAQVGALTGRIDLESTAPFVGLGYDNTFTRNGRLGFRLLAGAAFGDAPQVALDSTGGLFSDDPRFRVRLDTEEQDIQADADHYKVLPVVQVGLNYRF